MGADSLINLHTHTRSSDGDFRAEELVERASKDALTHLAITDHFDTLKVHSVSRNELEGYGELIRDLGRKHDGGLKVLAGVEIDTNPSRFDLWSLPFDDLNQLDLVLFEYLSDPIAGGIGMDDFEELRSNLKIPCGLAHTDLSRVFSHMAPKELADLLGSLDVFVEVNTAYLYKREGRYFFDIAEEYYRAFDGKVKVSVGTDVHHSISEVSNLSTAYSFLGRVGLEHQTVF